MLTYHENPRVTHSVCSDFGYMKYCRVAPATPQSIKLSEKRKSPTVHYDRKKCGPTNQADRSVRKADSAGRLDRNVRSNKAMGWVSKGKGGNRNPHSLWLPLWLLSGKAESNIKKKKFKNNIYTKYPSSVKLKNLLKQKISKTLLRVSQSPSPYPLSSDGVRPQTLWKGICQLSPSQVLFRSRARRCRERLRCCEDG